MSQDRDKQVYSKRVRSKLDSLETRKYLAEQNVRAINRQIEELLAGQSPIRVGSRITWVSANRERYGTVVAIQTVWRGFEYRVNVTTKAGRVIGSAQVSESQEPTLRED